jgi:aminopeptidase N
MRWSAGCGGGFPPSGASSATPSRGNNRLLSIRPQNSYIEATMRTEEHRPIRLQDYRPPDWLIETVHLDVSLHPTATIVRAKLKLKPNSAGTPAPLVLDGEDLKLSSLALDGKPLPAENYVASPERLTIAQPPNRPFELEIETIVDPTNNTQLMGLYRAGATYCTQCEAEGFRRITYFLDRPDVMAVYTTRIEADKSEAPVLLANGNLTAQGDVPGTARHFAVWHDPFPKPSYLFALVGGRLAGLRQFYDHVRPQGGAAHLCRTGQRGPLRLRHGQPQARHALG